MEEKGSSGPASGELDVLEVGVPLFFFFFWPFFPFLPFFPFFPVLSFLPFFPFLPIFPFFPFFPFFSFLPVVPFLPFVPCLICSPFFPFPPFFSAFGERVAVVIFISLASLTLLKKKTDCSIQSRSICMQFSDHAAVQNMLFIELSSQMFKI
jgi:hypothetical protein